MRFLNFLVLLYLCTPSTALLQFDISSISINFGSQISSFVRCYGVDIELFIQIATSNYTAQSTYFALQQDASLYNFQFDNSTTFMVPTTTDFISITGILSLSCPLQNSIDSFLVYNQISTKADKNNIQQGIQARSSQNSWSLNANVIRKCNGANEYGFNCNQQCTDKNDNNYCYTCGPNGQKMCCPSYNTNPDDCSLYDHITTISPIYQNCDASKESLYFWFMIGFVILSFFLILAIIILLLFVCGCFSASSSESKTDEEWITDPIEPRATHGIYDGDLNRRYNKRGEDIRNRDTPYIVGREGLENQSYYDDTSLTTDEWIEPLPRRVVQV